MTNTETPVVSLCRQRTYKLEEVQQSILKLLEPFGGIGRFVKSGDNVVLKPNLVMSRPESAPVCTNPVVFKAIAMLLLDLGARVRAGDSPGMGSARKVAKSAGLLAVAEELGIEIIEFTPKDVATPNGTFKKLTLAKELLEADVVINLPRLKTHGQMMLTAATKNMFGAVVGSRKFEWHYRAGKDYNAFARMIYEISDCIKADLHILDAVVAMDGMGPTAGTPNHTGFMAAGIDSIAIDATMMDILGRDPLDLYMIQEATKAGDVAWQERKVVGEDVAALRPAKWRWPRTVDLGLFAGTVFDKNPAINRFFRKFATVYPKASAKKCVKCNACVRICPAQAMTMGKDKVEIDYEKCIRCFCCHELCPHEAMDTKGGTLGKVLRTILPRLVR